YLARRCQYDAGSQTTHHLTAKPRDAKFETLQIIQRTDFTVEPAARLHAARSGIEGQHAERRIGLLPERLPAAKLQPARHFPRHQAEGNARDRKSTRLNSSHVKNSYAVFCLKKKIVYISPRLSGQSY